MSKSSPLTSAQKEILQSVKNSTSEYVKVAITDIDGILRGKYIDKEKFLSAVDHGFGFCNVVFGWDLNDTCYTNSVYTGWHTGYPDAQVLIDLNTYRQIPWDQNLAFFLGEFVDAHQQPLSICPRQLLKRVLARTEKHGLQAYCSMEFEWFNFRETPQSIAEKQYLNPQTLTPGMFGYSILRQSLNQPFFSALMNELREFNIPLEGLHTESGPGVFEGAIRYCEALTAADRGVLFKSAVREIAQRFNIMPSFMAKWNRQLPGCSGHTHQSLWDQNHKNVFYDAKDPQRMSTLFRSYVAGILHCLPEIMPFFAPNVNSYKRLVDGYWAPTKPTWGIDNRTVALRVIPGDATSTRVEARVPGSDVNSYLAIAACVASGLYGIEHELPLTAEPIIGSAYRYEKIPRLPVNLYEATRRLADSKLARELFGDEFVEHFVNTRFWEWEQFQAATTQWEMQRYFEII